MMWMKMTMVDHTRQQLWRWLLAAMEYTYMVQPYVVLAIVRVPVEHSPLQDAVRSSEPRFLPQGPPRERQVSKS